jgi:predicted ATPase/DNA-binding CsgD family transcriptional regulator
MLIFHLMNSARNSSLKPITGSFPRGQTGPLAAVPTNLPALRGRIIGREREMQAIQQMLSSDETRLVTLAGFGGAGKTTLALHLAELLANNFYGVYFVNLAPLIKSESIPLEVAHTLKVRYDAGRGMLDNLKESFIHRRILLVLDNFEHLMDGSGFVDDLLQALPLLQIIATSRDPLRLRAEQVYPLPPLTDIQAVELFIQRAQSVKPDFHPAEEERLAIAQLCHRLGGLPLAIELAALRVKIFTPQAMLARLQPHLEPASRYLNLFSASAKDLPERQRSLRQTIAWSYGLLDPEEQRTLRCASVFPGGFGILTLAKLLEVAEYSALELADSLADKNLIKPSAREDGDPHFTMLEAIREFAWDEIRALGELDGIKQRYVALYRDMAASAEPRLRGAEQLAWLEAIEMEYPNLMLAMEIGAAAAVDSQLWLDGLWILAHLEQYWMIRALFSELIPLASRALTLIQQSALTNDHPLTLKANLYGMAGTCAWLVTDFERARQFHETSLALHRQTDNMSRVAFALNNIGVCFSESGDQQAYFDYLEQSLAAYEKIRDDWGLARVCLNLSNYHLFIMKDNEMAVSWLKRGLHHAEQIGDPYLKATAAYALGEIYMLSRQYESARPLYKQVIDSMRLHKMSQPLIWALTGQAALAMLADDFAGASASIRESAPLSLEQMDKEVIAANLRLTMWHCFARRQFLPAAFLLGAEEALHNHLGRIHSIPQYWDDMEIGMRSARAELGEAAFNAEYERGRIQPLDEVIAFVLETCLPVMDSAPLPANPLLTERESETLRLLVQGKTNQQISQELFVTLKTVEKHVANIFRKLGVKNRTEAAAWALENQPK